MIAIIPYQDSRDDTPTNTGSQSFLVWKIVLDRLQLRDDLFECRSAIWVWVPAFFKKPKLFRSKTGLLLSPQSCKANIYLALYARK